MKTLGAVALLAAVLVMVTGTTAGADAVYHSERLEFAAGGDPDFHGQVVNIHPNGPVNGALERYQVVGATPDTTYAVWIQTCDGGFADFINTTDLVTDKQGNGHAAARFTAEDLDPFEGAVVTIRWALKLGGVAVYTTDCTTVTID